VKQQTRGVRDPLRKKRGQPGWDGERIFEREKKRLEGREKIFGNRRGLYTVPDKIERKR